MFCKHCGNKNIDQASFCKTCGKKINRNFIKAKFKLNPGKKGFWFIPLIVITIIYLINSGSLSSFINIYPFWLTTPKQEKLKCSYSGKNLEVGLTLYGNIDNYYRNLPDQEKFISEGNFDKFVYTNSKDKSIRDLSTNIKNIARLNGLSDDQTLELASCFVQNIPYDNTKYEEIKKTSNTANTEQFPYETLYDNKGVCTDKTYLGSAILKEMGYGTGIMLFPNDSHMTLGIKVPEGYTSFNSKYAIMDVTTVGFAPGLIPATVEKSNGTPNSNIKNLNTLNKNDNPDNISLDTTKEIGPPTKVITVNDGKTYTRIVAVKNLEKEILSLIASLDTKKANLQSAKANISYADSRQAQAYNDYLSTPSTTRSCYPICSYYPYYSCYQNCYTSSNFLKNLKYSTYTMAYNNYENSINRYNQLVDDYNNTLGKIDGRINTYNTYQYN